MSTEMIIFLLASTVFSIILFAYMQSKIKDLSVKLAETEKYEQKAKEYLRTKETTIKKLKNLNEMLIEQTNKKDDEYLDLDNELTDYKANSAELISEEKAKLNKTISALGEFNKKASAELKKSKGELKIVQNFNDDQKDELKKLKDEIKKVKANTKTYIKKEVKKKKEHSIHLASDILVLISDKSQRAKVGPIQKLCEEVLSDD